MNIQNTCEHLLSLLEKDPVRELFEEKEFGKEYLYTIRLLEWAKKLNANLSNELRVAICGHHIYRWKIPRNSYPITRQGYHQWRTKLKNMHAEETAKILMEEGYSEDFTERVKAIITKNNIQNDAEVQLFEDAINLTFIEFYLKDFAKKHPREKLVAIAMKILRKMSESAIQKALVLNLPGEHLAILEEAVNKKQYNKSYNSTKKAPG